MEVRDFYAQILNLSNEQLVDVRTPEEWETGILDGAMKINFRDADFLSRLKELDSNRPVMVYCRSGGRSSEAMKMLNELGFKEVYNLVGGMQAWRSANYKVVKQSN